MSPNAFAKWLDSWLEVKGWQGDRLAEAMDASESMVSKWRNGLNLPDAKFLARLSDVTGESVFYLAHLAYGWPDTPPTDDLMKEPGVKEIAKLVKELGAHDPELVDDANALVKTLLLQAKRRSKK